jgi:hypothetical protein
MDGAKAYFYIIVAPGDLRLRRRRLGDAKRLGTLLTLDTRRLEQFVVRRAGALLEWQRDGERPREDLWGQ